GPVRPPARQMGHDQYRALLAVLPVAPDAAGDRYPDVSGARRQRHGADALVRNVVHSGLRRLPRLLAVAPRRRGTALKNIPSWTGRHATAAARHWRNAGAAR